MAVCTALTLSLSYTMGHTPSPSLFSCFRHSNKKGTNRGRIRCSRPPSPSRPLTLSLPCLPPLPPTHPKRRVPRDGKGVIKESFLVDLGVPRTGCCNVSQGHNRIRGKCVKSRWKLYGDMLLYLRSLFRYKDTEEQKSNFERNGSQSFIILPVHLP